MAIEVLSPGMLTTVQDKGRIGAASDGYPECGACDMLSYITAVLIVGNSATVAALECTYLGPELRFTEEAVACVVGADVHLNGEPYPEGTPIPLRAGDVLKVGLAHGMRSYLAVYGGINVKSVRNSCSTDLKCGIGGFEGRALRKGDVLPIVRCDAWKVYRQLKTRLERGGVALPMLANDPVVHVIPGPQADMFTDHGLEAFCSSEYSVAPESNRMGIRLNGIAVESKSGTDILSDAIVNGSVQIAANGLPIVMLSDHQTTGGYAKIATVIPTDLPILAQLRPGQKLRFEWIDPADALRKYRSTAQRLISLKKRMDLSSEESRPEFRPRRKLWRLYDRNGRRHSRYRHLGQCGMRFSRG